MPAVLRVRGVSSEKKRIDMNDNVHLQFPSIGAELTIADVQKHVNEMEGCRNICDKASDETWTAITALADVSKCLTIKIR